MSYEAMTSPRMKTGKDERKTDYPKRLLRVLEVHPLRQGALRAFVTLQIGPLVIYRARYIRQDGQRGYVAPPQEAVAGPDGERRFLPALKWPEEWKQPILEAVLAAVGETEPAVGEAEGAADRQTAFGTEVRRRAGLAPHDGAAF